MQEPPDKPAALEDYPLVITLPVQWGDQDAFGHVNNVVYFRWFESARIAYFEQTGVGPLLRDHGLGPILASIKCDYRRQLTYPETVYVGAKITRVGNSSLSMAHRLVTPGGASAAAESDSVIVIFNYQTNTSQRIPDDVRAKIDEVEISSP